MRIESARLLRQGNLYLVADAGSAGGTFLNGERLTEPAPLSSGERQKRTK